MATDPNDTRREPCPYCKLVDFFQADLLFRHRHLVECSRLYIDGEFKRIRAELKMGSLAFWKRWFDLQAKKLQEIRDQFLEGLE